MSQAVNGKTAIVTGAGSGISLAFAMQLLEQGANVVFADLILRPEAQELVNRYSTSQPRAVFQQTDVTNWTQLSSLFDLAVKIFGNVDIICPGAGVYEPDFSNFWIPPGREVARDTLTGGRYMLIDINLVHPIRMTQLAISYFMAANPPVSPSNPKTVVIISSTAGQKTPLVAPMYAATKHALNGFVRCLGPLESKIGVRVAAVAPGIVRTPLWTEDASKSQALDQEKDEWVTPEEVAKAMCDLISKDSTDGTTTQSSAQKESSAGDIPIHGGTILEITTGRLRNVGAFNDPGPSGAPGSTASNMVQLEDGVWDLVSRAGELAQMCN